MYICYRFDVEVLIVCCRFAVKLVVWQVFSRFVVDLLLVCYRFVVDMSCSRFVVELLLVCCGFVANLPMRKREGFANCFGSGGAGFANGFSSGGGIGVGAGRGAGIREQVAEQVRLYERGERLSGFICLAHDIQRLRATFRANKDVADRYAPLESTIESLLDALEFVEVRRGLILTLPSSDS